jgi:hypothetical protein
MGILSGGDHTTWQVRLVKSGDLTFLDALQLQENSGDIFSLRIALHVFFRLQKDGDQLRFSALSSDWYEQQLEQKQFPLKVERLGENVPAITSPAAEVRAYFTKVATDPHAFVEVAKLQRYQPPAAAKPSP